MNRQCCCSWDGRTTKSFHRAEFMHACVLTRSPLLHFALRQKRTQQYGSVILVPWKLLISLTRRLAPSHGFAPTTTPSRHFCRRRVSSPAMERNAAETHNASSIRPFDARTHACVHVCLMDNRVVSCRVLFRRIDDLLSPPPSVTTHGEYIREEIRVCG